MFCESTTMNSKIMTEVSQSQSRSGPSFTELDAEIDMVEQTKNKMLVNMFKSKKAPLFKDLVNNNFPKPQKVSKKVRIEISECTTVDTEEVNSNGRSSPLGKSCPSLTSFDMTTFMEESQSDLNMTVMDLEDSDFDYKKAKTFQELRSEPVECENACKSMTNLSAEEVKPLNIKGYWCAGLKGPILMECIAVFQQELKMQMTSEDKSIFNTHVQGLLDFCEANEKFVSTSHAESIAGCILLLVSTQLGIGKKQFLNALSPMKKRMFQKVEHIKKSSCYTQLKNGYSTIKAKINKRK